MAITHPPTSPVKWPPADQGRGPYVVQRNDSFESIARQNRIDPWTLIAFNFRTTRPDEVNWYLANYLHCTRQTHDGKNYVFSGGETIYLPLVSPADCGRGNWAGMFAHTWDANEISLFQQWVRTKGTDHVDQANYRRDCCDFAISVLMEYAAMRRLPVALHNGPSQHWKGLRNIPEGDVCADPEAGGEVNVVGLRFKSYHVNYAALELEARYKVLAQHLYNVAFGNTVAIAFGQLQPGDLLVRPGSAHVQVVLKPHSTIEAKITVYLPTGPTTRLTTRPVLEIAQGNLPDPATATVRQRIEQAVPIKHKAWDLNPGSGPDGAVFSYYVEEGGKWFEVTPDTELRTFEARRWNFGTFNHAYNLVP